MTKKHIRDRIRDAIKTHGSSGFLNYYDLARFVFPESDFPNAWGSPTRGGPPGCYMALSKAIRVHEFYMELNHDGVVHSKVGLGKKNY